MAQIIITKKDVKPPVLTEMDHVIMVPKAWRRENALSSFMETFYVYTELIQSIFSSLTETT